MFLFIVFLISLQWRGYQPPPNRGMGCVWTAETSHKLFNPKRHNHGNDDHDNYQWLWWSWWNDVILHKINNSVNRGLNISSPPFYRWCTRNIKVTSIFCRDISCQELFSWEIFYREIYYTCIWCTGSRSYRRGIMQELSSWAFGNIQFYCFLFWLYAPLRGALSRLAFRDPIPSIPSSPT